MKFKRLSIIFCFLFIVIFSGCANVQFSRTINENGSIVDAVAVTLDLDELKKANYDTDTVIAFIEQKMNGYLSNIITSFKIREDNLDEIVKLTVLQNITSLVYHKDNIVVALLKFKNYGTFKYFYGLHLIEDTDNTIIEEGFLVNKYISSGKTIFAGEDARFIENEFLSYFNEDFTLNDVTYEYTFGTTDDKLYSDADYNFSEDGINYHQWIIKSNNTNREIKTYNILVKPVNWYLTALITTAVFILISFGIVTIKKFRTKKSAIN